MHVAIQSGKIESVKLLMSLAPETVLIEDNVGVEEVKRNGDGDGDGNIMVWGAAFVWSHFISTEFLHCLRATEGMECCAYGRFLRQRERSSNHHVNSKQESNHECIRRNELASLIIIAISTSIPITTCLQDSSTALHLASIRGHFSCVEFLVERIRADPTLRNLVRLPPRKAPYIAQYTLCKTIRLMLYSA